jgi:inhibitor of cysteine peptidase
LSTTVLDDFNAREIFIHEDRLLIFGSAYNRIYKNTPPTGEDIRGMPSPNYVSSMSVRLYDISNKEDPELVKQIDFEGNYLTSRKIGEYAYFVVNSYPHYNILRNEPKVCDDIVPLYKESGEDPRPIARCVDIGYIEPIQAEQFITIASISMETEEVEKEVIVGSGQNVYASLDNLYVSQTSWPRYRYDVIGEPKEEEDWQKTVITKFELDDGDIDYVAKGEVKGHILNQFSMDEYEDNFRIATTISGYSNNVDTSTNNMYVLDEDMDLIGELEGIAPGESIYSVRFMGKRGYMVTFRHVDPLFVIDLSDPEDPEILGKLKIPGYSDYLHPYDETHLIGIGKEVDASIDADKIHTEGAVYYTAIQGVKLAIFDVSDVSNPIEMYKEVIGDRGTESPATSDHKAFLFDKERELLVVPMTVAELKPGQDKSMQGEYTFQGAYVYNINLEEGFDLKGRVTHYDDDEAFEKAGYYFRGDSSVKRSLYIEDVLYTLSDSRLQLNDLDDLDRLKVLEFEKNENSGSVRTNRVEPTMVTLD